MSRLVSEADSREATGTSPADYPIFITFQAITLTVTSHAVAYEALRAFQQFATCTTFGYFIPESGSHSVDPTLSSPMLYQLSYPVPQEVFTSHADIFNVSFAFCPVITHKYKTSDACRSCSKSHENKGISPKKTCFHFLIIRSVLGSFEFLVFGFSHPCLFY